jgi:type IV pilus assembly protein PilA
LKNKGFSRKPRRAPRGFTLVELMIVVAIIGILAAIAIPNFMKFLAKTKKSEARYNLEAIYKAEISYFGEANTFSSDFNEIRWRPDGTIYYYTFTAGAGYLGKPVASNPQPPEAHPGASSSSFTACAWGNIDTDPALDVWDVTDRKDLVNRVDDLQQ